MFKKSIITLFTMGVVLMSACTSDDCNDASLETSSVKQVLKYEQGDALSRLASVLSQATYNDKGVREFLKSEALTQFDKNYDVLYAKVKDLSVGGVSFENIMAQYSSKEEMEAIFMAVPTLNIYIPCLSMFDVTPENLNCEEKDIPIILPGKEYNGVYLDGQLVDSIKVGELPGFHTFVVNTNSRVSVEPISRSGGASYRFLDEAFNGEKSLWSTPVSCESKSRIASFSPAASYSLLGSKVIEAYSYFNASSGSSNACSYQRDYIYYGMTPSSSTGILNPDIFEYMTFIEIDPDAYLLMTDKNDPETDDPQLLSSTKDRCDFTKAELLNKVWTKGSYNIRVEMVLSKSTEPDVKYIGLKSEDIWDFSDSYYRSDYVHPTLFRHSKYTYTVDPAKFIKKRYYLPEKEFQFDRWNLAEEGLSRRIRFYEVDPGVLVTKKYTYDVTRVTSAKVNGNVKFGLGEKSTYNAGVERESSSSTTITETKEVTTSFTDEDDDLGIATINFYDPIIEGMSGSDYVVKTYSTGHARVTFGITAR